MVQCEHCGAIGVRMETLGEHTEELGCYVVTLTGCVVRRTCPACGKSSTAIPDSMGLMKALAMARMLAPIKLSGSDIKFLRQTLGMTGRAFAQTFELTPETVSRWEHNGRGVGGLTDKLVRHTACALLQQHGSYDPLKITQMQIIDPDRMDAPLGKLHFRFVREPVEIVGSTTIVPPGVESWTRREEAEAA